MTSIESIRADFSELLHGRHRESCCALVSEQAQTILTPLFIARSAFDTACAAAVGVYRALEIAVERLLVDAPLRRRIGIAAYVDPLLELDRDGGQPSLVGRLDGFIGGDGVIRFIENNGFDPGSNPRFIRAHAALPIYKDLATHHAFSHVFGLSGASDAIAADQRRRGRPPVPQIAFIHRNHGEGDVARWLYNVARDAGFPTLVVPASEVSYSDGIVRVGDTPIDILDVNEYEVFGEDPEIEHVVAAVRDGAVRLPYGISRGILLNYKSVFEVLTDDDLTMFDADLQRIVRTHVPWTRFARDRRTSYRGESIDLLPFIQKNRERFVLKPCSGASGTGVVVGHATSDAEWSKVIDRARVTAYVVQEIVDVGPLQSLEYLDSATREMRTDLFTSGLDPFVWAGYGPGGAYSRVARSGLHNLSTGASSAPLVVVEE